jgi:nitrogen fixation NifU-like protein
VYTKKVLSTFQNPKNYGKIKNADAVGKAGNITCGDVMAIYIKIDHNKKGEPFIKDISFETFGCVAAIATSSMITELAKGKTLVNALKITKSDIIQKLDGLPKPKIHCSLLSTDALFEAVYDYYSKNNPKLINEQMHEKHLHILATQNKIEDMYPEWFKQESKKLKNK